jgi:hypothetical protein
VRKGHFQHQPSPQWRATVAVLQGLAEAEGVTSVHTAYAEAVAEKYLVDFMRTRQVIRRPGTHVCLYRLLGKRCPRYSCQSPSMIPRADHMSEWLSDLAALWPVL